MTNQKAFTLIEILVVATIIGLLLAGAVASYTTLNRSSRDARRKADAEQIRSALEMYRSNNNYYPNSLIIMLTPTVYIQSLPVDPQPTPYSYVYTPLPSGCTATATCNDYTLGSYIEDGSADCSPAVSCGSSNCKYCVGPYGKK